MTKRDAAKGESTDFAPLTDDHLVALETTVKKLIGTNVSAEILDAAEKDLLARWMVEVRRTRALQRELSTHAESTIEVIEATRDFWSKVVFSLLPGGKADLPPKSQELLKELDDLFQSLYDGVRAFAAKGLQRRNPPRDRKGREQP